MVGYTHIRRMNGASVPVDITEGAACERREANAKYSSHVSINLRVRDATTKRA
jgi:hypothetical protein